jgi:hypothetical protein
VNPIFGIWRVVLLLILGCMPVLLYGQGLKATGDSMSISPREDFSFVNGWEYRVKIAASGTPFLKSNEWITGRLKCDAGTFDRLLMNYDLYQEVLVIQQNIEGKPCVFAMNPIFVQDFWLSGFHFRNIQDAGNEASPGYYELLYDGKVQILRKWKKKIIDEKVINGSSFRTEQRMFIMYQNKLIPIRGRRSIANIFPDHAKEISRYCSTHGFHPRTTGKESWISLGQFIDQLP